MSRAEQGKQVEGRLCERRGASLCKRYMVWRFLITHPREGEGKVEGERIVQEEDILRISNERSKQR